MITHVYIVLLFKRELISGVRSKNTRYSEVTRVVDVYLDRNDAEKRARAIEANNASDHSHNICAGVIKKSIKDSKESRISLYHSTRNKIMDVVEELIYGH